MAKKQTFRKSLNKTDKIIEEGYKESNKENVEIAKEMEHLINEVESSPKTFYVWSKFLMEESMKGRVKGEGSIEVLKKSDLKKEIEEFEKKIIKNGEKLYHFQWMSKEWVKLKEQLLGSEKDEMSVLVKTEKSESLKVNPNSLPSEKPKSNEEVRG